jgi:hypothetical protein
MYASPQHSLLPSKLNPSFSISAPLPSPSRVNCNCKALGISGPACTHASVTSSLPKQGTAVTHRRHAPRPRGIQLPLQARQHLRKRQSSAHHRKLDAQTRAAAAVETNERRLCTRFAEQRLHLLGRLAPALGPEGVRIGAPGRIVAVGGVAVVAAVCAFFEEDGVAEEDVGFGAAVHELRDWGVEAQGFVDCGCEGGELGEGVRVEAVGGTEREDLLAKGLLEALRGC